MHDRMIPAIDHKLNTYMNMNMIFYFIVYVEIR